MTKEELKAVIERGQESESIDFKREFYNPLKSSDFPKDIAAFANTETSEKKVIIFGVDDDTRNPVGIGRDSLPSQDAIDDYISRTIEPFVKVLIGVNEIKDGLFIGYIEILAETSNRPYVISRDCGQNNGIKKGDVFIRKGTTVQKATKEDFDAFQKKSGTIHVRIFDQLSTIEPVLMTGELPEKPTYGIISLEIINTTSKPILIKDGDVFISYNDKTHRRRIISILPSRNIQDNPIKLDASSRSIQTILYSFSSSDCVDLGFDPHGFLDQTVDFHVELIDTDENVYKSDTSQIMLIAKGDILHKVRLLYKQKNTKMRSLFNSFENTHKEE